MLVTPSGMTMLVRLRQELNVLLPISVRPEGRVTFARFEQPENASLPMLVTPSGMTMLVRLSQELNALLPISVRLEGRGTFVRLEQ